MKEKVEEEQDYVVGMDHNPTCSVRLNSDHFMFNVEKTVNSKEILCSIAKDDWSQR